MPQRTGSKHFHRPEKCVIRGNFVLWSRRNPKWRQPQDLGFKIWEVRYWIQTCCLHLSERQCLTDCWVQSRQGTVTLALFLHLFSCHSSDADQYVYKLPTINKLNELFTKIQHRICASWRVLTLEWLTKISTKILNTIWKLRRSFGPTSNDSSLNWIFTVQWKCLLYTPLFAPFRFPQTFSTALLYTTLLWQSTKYFLFIYSVWREKQPK